MPDASLSAPGPKPSAPTTSIVVLAFTSSAVSPPRRRTSARASRLPSELSFPVKTTSWPASGFTVLLVSVAPAGLSERRPGASGEGEGKPPPLRLRRWEYGTQHEGEYCECQSRFHAA